MNVAPQGFLNQCLAQSIELEQIAAIQAQIEAKLAQLADVTALKNSATTMRDTLQNVRSQSQTADTQASNVENALPALAASAETEANRVIPINNKLDSISNTTYQAYSAVLGAIGAASVSADKYIYSASNGDISYTTPQLSTGTRMQDCILQATLAGGAPSPAIAGDVWSSLPLVQTLNMAGDVMAWNASARELLLSAGEYSIDAYIVASRTQLVQLSLLQGSTRYLGTSGKGTNDNGVIASENLSIYSHLMTSFKINSTRVYIPQVYLSSGSIVSSSLNETTPWAFMRVRYYQA
jgi:hypothetical protein